MNLRHWALALLICSLIACKDQKKPIQIDQDGFVLTLPGYLDQDELAEDGIVEYANRFRNFYVAGFRLDSKLTMDSIWTSANKRITSSLKDFKVDTSYDYSKMRIVRIQGHFEGEPEPITYTQKIISTDSQRYLLTVWIRGEKRYDRYKEDVDAIMTSFKTK